jgi:PPK2 family polyphosphate:nucleotide phosphotransferase
MHLDALIQEAHDLAQAYCITDGDTFRLKDLDPAETAGLEAEDKPRAQAHLQTGVQALAALQDRLYAQNRWAVLLIFQGMDAAGKDSAIKHVMAGVNPQGCQVVSFKAPSPEELDHDYLWRCHTHLPARGRIGIFNRSYYEEVLVVRVHADLLQAQHLPPALITDDLWYDRLRDIRRFERYLHRNGVLIRKFFLHVSPQEQKQRFLERLDNPAKHWKFSAADVRERSYWSDYMAAYEAMIRHTATETAPWYAVPADHKWFTRLVVAAAIIDALASLDLDYPPLDATQRQALTVARQALLAEPEPVRETRGKDAAS